MTSNCLPDPYGLASHCSRAETVDTYILLFHTIIHENIKKFIRRLPLRRSFDGNVGEHCLLPFHLPPRGQDQFSSRVTAKADLSARSARCPLIAAFVYCYSRGCPMPIQTSDLSHTGNFLNMLLKMTELNINPTQSSSMPWMFFSFSMLTIADCGTNAMRQRGKLSRGLLFRGCGCGRSSLYGPLHGGVNERCCRM